MGLAASQARLLMLTARLSDLRLQEQFISQARMGLANIVGTLFSLSANLEPESPQMQALKARIAAIQAIDKSLELQMKRIETQANATQQEIESVQKIVNKAIESGFKYGGMG